MGLSSFKRQDPRAAAIADEEDAIAQILPFVHLTPELFYGGLNLVQVHPVAWSRCQAFRPILTR